MPESRPELGMGIVQGQPPKPQGEQRRERGSEWLLSAKPVQGADTGPTGLSAWEERRNVLQQTVCTKVFPGFSTTWRHVKGQDRAWSLGKVPHSLHSGGTSEQLQGRVRPLSPLASLWDQPPHLSVWLPPRPPIPVEPAHVPPTGAHHEHVSLRRGLQKSPDHRDTA